MLIPLVIALTTYIGIVFYTKYRTPISVLGSATLLIYGTFTETFSSTLAFQNFPKEIVILIVVLALFTKVFEKNGIFNYIGYQFIRVSKGKKILIGILLPVVTYSTSLFMNNLSVILLLTFMCLELAIHLNLPIVPLLVSTIIASNIGGAPLPWSDTPAVILTLYTDFTLMDFITKLFLPCLIYIVCLAAYTTFWFKKSRNPDYSDKVDLALKPHVNNKHPEHLEDQLKLLHHLEAIQNVNKKHEHHKHHKEHHLLKHNLNWKEIRVPIFLFILLIAGICIGPFLEISIAYTSMFFGALLLILNKKKPEETINAIPILDSLAFITALFLIGGVLEHSGVLKIAVSYILTFTGSNKLLILLSIMFSAFTIATFLSAGPAAATLLPMCVQLSSMVGNKLVYAALALGILAGSSMLPWSATGGPVMLGEVNRFLQQKKIKPKEREKIIEIYNLKHYIAFSIPFSLFILILSGIFLSIYLKIC